MKSLYLMVDILTILFPFLLSFDKKVGFYKHWKYLAFPLILVGVPFIVWDVLFTHYGCWGFTPDYLIGINLFNLPLEEVLFFIVVPYACTFIYACVKVYFPKLQLKKFNTIFLSVIAIYSLLVFVAGWTKPYSQIVALVALFTLLLVLRSNLKLSFLPLAFSISLVPFLIVNGVLTGIWTDEPIVWYGDTAIIGIRIIEIPIEDILYSWGLLALNILAYEFFLERKRKMD